VRRRAVAALASKGAGAVAAIDGVVRRHRSPEARLNAVWGATRIDAPGARQAVRAALRHADETVRHAACHATGLWRDRGATAELVRLLKSPQPHNRRAAAEALGRLGDAAAVPALLAATAAENDRALEHSLTFALIEIADAGATAAGLKSDSPRTRRAALTALDQMEGGGLKAETVAAEMTALDARVRATAWWIAGRHPEWGATMSGFLRDRLGGELAAAERADLERQLARFARSAAIQQLLAERLRDGGASRAARQVVLRAMAQSSLREAPAVWLAALREILDGGNAELTHEAVVTVRALRLPKKGTEKVVAALLRIGGDARGAAVVRLNALAAVPGGLTVEPALFDFLRAEVKSDRPVATRGLAAEVLSRARLSQPQLLTLTETVKGAGPMELERVLDAFTQTADDKVGAALLAALKESAAKSALSVGALRPRLEKYGAAVRKQAEGLYAELDADTAKQRARLEEALAGLEKGEKGDVRRGQAVFNGPKGACFSCHQIGYLGGKVGPDLTRIGSVRTERDLLESVMYPSASFVRGYESVLVATHDGKLHNGILKRDAADEVVLAVSADKEERIARDEIERMQPGRVSVMPSGLDQQLTRQELADLIAFLKACR
jgi:putative heme-binding domain-containing protein